jgi:hypothetical protein
MLWALSLALESAGRSMAAKMAIMAMTTNSSIRVNAAEGRLLFFFMTNGFTLRS